MALAQSHLAEASRRLIWRLRQRNVPSAYTITIIEKGPRMIPAKGERGEGSQSAREALRTVRGARMGSREQQRRACELLCPLRREREDALLFAGRSVSRRGGGRSAEAQQGEASKKKERAHCAAEQRKRTQKEWYQKREQRRRQMQAACCKPIEVREAAAKSRRGALCSHWSIVRSFAKYVFGSTFI